MNSRQVFSGKTTFHSNPLPSNKYPNQVSRLKESGDNSGLNKASASVDMGRTNTSLKGVNELVDHLPRAVKKPHRVPSIHTTHPIRLGVFLNLPQLIEQSIKQVNEYRAKFETSLLHQSANQRIHEMNSMGTNSLAQFPLKPPIPIELREKLQEKTHLDFLSNPTSKKIDDGNTLIGRYDITHLRNPIADLHFSERNENVSINLFDHVEEYSKYFDLLLNEYLTNGVYEHGQSRIICLALTEQIKDLFQKLSQRYKILVQVYIQQHFDQSILMASRSLHDSTADQFLEKRFWKGNTFILILVYFVYKQ